MIDYEALLESFDYDQERIKKYFDKLISSLDSEAFLLKEERKTSIENKYNLFKEVLDKDNEEKEKILKNYLNDFKALNESYNNYVLSLDNKYFENRNKILDQIDENNLKIKEIQNSYVLDLYNAKKPYITKNNIIENEIDKEYFDEAEFIFNSKEKLLQNREFYINSESHLKDLKKTLLFFNKLSNIESNNENETNNLETVDLSMLNCLESFTNDNLSFDSFETIKNTNFDIYKSILERFNNIDNNAIDLNKINSFDNIKQSKEFLRFSKLINKLENNTNEYLSIYKSIDRYFNEKERNILETFKISLSNFEDNLSTSYKKLVDDNKILIDSKINDTKIIINKINDEYKKYVDGSSSIKVFYNSLKSTLDNEEISNEIIFLKNYIEYINKILSYSLKLDTVAFELLTSKEVLKLKLLDLKKQFLTIDNKIKIKEIEYNFKQLENEACFDIETSSSNFKHNIKILENDLILDKKIKLNEISNELYELELKKNIDILKIDYQISNNKLNSLKELSEQELIYKKNISNINSKIDFEKHVEDIILDSIKNKKEYENLISSYNEKIIKIENDSDQKIRYLNDILEVERENFTVSKEKALKISKSFNELIYPELIKNKSASSKLIKIINEEYDKRIETIKENAKLAGLYKKDSLLKGLNIYNSYKNTLKTYFKFNYECGIDRSSAITLIIYNFKKYINSLNELLLVFNNKIIIDDKLFRLTISKYLNRVAYNDTFTISYKNIFKLYKKYYLEFKNHISFYKILNDKELDVLTSKIDKKRKNKIAKIVVENTLSAESYLKDLDKIDSSRKKIDNKFEDKVSEFKSIYLNTLDQIKIEYDKKISELNKLKVLSENNIKSLNTNLNNSIKEAYIKNASSFDLKIQNAINNNENNITGIDSTISYLNKDITEKDKLFSDELYLKSKEKDLKNIQISNEAKELYKTFEKEQELILKERQKLITEKERNKSLFLNKINKESYDFKSSYQQKAIEIKEKINNNIIDNQIKYSKLLNESISILKENTNNLINIINNNLTKTEELTNNLSIESKSNINSQILLFKEEKQDE